MVDEIFQQPNPIPSEVYQSHRVLLAAGKTEPELLRRALTGVFSSFRLDGRPISPIYW